MNEAGLRPTLRQLEAFVRVARLGSFARAANELSLSQPALSQAITQLERSLNTVLIQRTTRSAYLSVDGEFLLPVAERVLHELDGALHELRETAKARRSKVSVGAMPSLAVGLMPHVMQRFAREHSSVQVVLHDAPSESLYRGIESGQFDLAISSRLAERPGLDFESLLDDRFHLVVQRDHPLARRRSVRWAELEAWPVIGFAGGTGTRSALMSELARAGITFRPVMEMAFSSTILGMVEAGLGVAALTSFSLPPAGHPALVSICLTHPRISREVGIVTASSRSPTPAAEAFIETIRTYTVTLTEHRLTASPLQARRIR